MFSQERQPSLNGLRVAILDLYKTSRGYTLKVLLTFFKDEIAPGNGPPLNDTGKRDRSKSRYFEVVCRSESEV